MSFSYTITENNNYSIIQLKDGDTCVVEIYTFGGIVNSFIINDVDKKINIIDGFSSVDNAIKNITNSFKSAFLSPFVCRMNKGEYGYLNNRYSVNKFYLPPHAIHGLVYDANYSIINTEANDDEAFTELEFTYLALDNGYPHQYTVRHCYTLQANNTLKISSTVTNKTNVPIPYAQGWHPYFTLGESIDNCTLQFTSKDQLEFDDTLLPTGKIVVDDRFESDTLLKDITLDNCYLLRPSGKCILQNKKLALIITPNTNYNFLQVYTPESRNSIAIENLSGAPDCFNNGLGLTLIEPNSSIIFATTYQVVIPLN